MIFLNVRSNIVVVASSRITFNARSIQYYRQSGGQFGYKVGFIFSERLINYMFYKKY